MKSDSDILLYEISEIIYTHNIKKRPIVFNQFQHTNMDKISERMKEYAVQLKIGRIYYK